MIKYKTYTKEHEIKTACALAAKHRLAVPGWMFFEFFRDGRENGPNGRNHITKVTMAFDDDKPIGVTLNYKFSNESSPYVGCFVKKPHRRKGVGSGLIKSHKEVGGIPRIWGEGCKQADKFWLKNSGDMRVIVT